MKAVISGEASETVPWTFSGEMSWTQADPSWPHIAKQSHWREKRLQDQVLLQLSWYASSSKVWGLFSFLETEAVVSTLAMNLFYFQMGPPNMREVQSPSHHHSDTQSRTPRHEPWTRNQLYYLVTLLKSHNVDHGSHQMDHGILQSTLKTANKPFLGKWAAEQQELGSLQLPSPLLFPLFFPGSRDLSSPQ